MSECRKMQIDPYLSPCTKLKSKWIKILNIKPDTLSLIEEKVRNILEHRTPVCQRSTIDKWELIKLKGKYIVNRTKWHYTDWEKIFTNHMSDRGLISKIYKILKKLDSNKSNNSIKNGIQR